MNWRRKQKQESAPNYYYPPRKTAVNGQLIRKRRRGYNLSWKQQVQYFQSYKTAHCENLTYSGVKVLSSIMLAIPSTRDISGFLNSINQTLRMRRTFLFSVINILKCEPQLTTIVEWTWNDRMKRTQLKHPCVLWWEILQDRFCCIVKVNQQSQLLLAFVIFDRKWRIFILVNYSSHRIWLVGSFAVSAPA